MLCQAAYLDSLSHVEKASYTPYPGPCTLHLTHCLILCTIHILALSADLIEGVPAGAS